MPESRNASQSVLAEKGEKFLKKLDELVNSKEFKAGQVATKEIQLTASLAKLANVTDPKKATVVITAVFVQKAMTAAGLTSKEETVRCLKAVSNLGADFAAAALLAPTTLGVGALLPLALAAVDAYEVGQACFNTSSGTAHAVSAPLRRDVKAGLKTSKHGPI